jgi:hypothetical protein
MDKMSEKQAAIRADPCTLILSPRLIPPGPSLL